MNNDYVTWIIIQIAAFCYAVIIHIIAYFFAPRLRNWYASKSAKNSQKRMESLGSELLEYKHYSESPFDLILYINKNLLKLFIVVFIMSFIMNIMGLSLQSYDLYSGKGCGYYISAINDPVAKLTRPMVKPFIYKLYDYYYFIISTISTILSLYGYFICQKTFVTLNRVRNINDYSDHINRIIDYLKKKAIHN